MDASMEKTAVIFTLNYQIRRIVACSSTQHRKSDCPHKPMNPDPGQNPKGQGKQNGQTDRRGPGDGRGKKGSKGSSASDSTGNHKGSGDNDRTKEQDKGKGTTSTTTTTEDKTIGDAKGEPNKDQGGQTQGETGSTHALMSEMTSLLRSMRLGYSTSQCY